MNFSTAMRQNATNIFNGGWLLYVPLAFIGFNPVWIGICFALSLVYQFFIHTTLVTKLHPAIEAVMNTPNHHRVRLLGRPALFLAVERMKTSVRTDHANRVALTS